MVKAFFQTKSDLLSVVEQGLDILCISKTQVLIDDTSDKCLCPGCHLLRSSLCKGISKDLNCEECFLAEASSVLITHWYSLHNQIFTAHLQNWYEKQGLRETSCLKCPGHCTTPVGTVKAPAAYQRVMASVLCAVQRARQEDRQPLHPGASSMDVRETLACGCRRGLSGWQGSLVLVHLFVAIASWEVLREGVERR